MLGIKKRKSSVSDADKASTKRIKKEDKKNKYEDADITEEVFKTLIGEQETTLSGFTRFLEQTQRYEDGASEYDIIGDYLKNSPECVEVLEVLMREIKKGENLIKAIFECLERILLYIESSEENYKTSSNAILYSILERHIRCVFFMMDMQKKSRYIKSALKLLTAMVVVQDSKSAKRVLDKVDWEDKVLRPLLNRTDMNDTRDVRTCYLQLLVSFLVTDDPGLAKQVVETKGLLNPIFSDMHADKASTIQFVLPRLLTEVVKNLSISKTSKIRLFNNKVLKDLAKLFLWTGPYQTGNKHKAQPLMEVLSAEENEEQQSVRDAVSELLLELCTNHKHGVIFRDKTYGTSDKNQNHFVTTLLSSIQLPALQRPRVRNFITQVLEACPDQLQYYLPCLTVAPRLQNQHVKREDTDEVMSTLKPQDTVGWGKQIGFLKEIYLGQLHVCPVFTSSDNSSTAMSDKRVSVAIAAMLPHKAVLKEVHNAVKHTSPSVSKEGLEMLIVLLKNIQSSLRAVAPISNKTERMFINDFKEELYEELIPVEQILNLWRDSCKDENEKKPAIEPVNPMPPTSRTSLQGLLLQVLCLYQSVIPEEDMETLEHGMLLEGLRSTGEEEGGTLRLYMLSLLAGSSSEDIRWLKKNASGRSTLYLLLEMIYTAERGSKLQYTIVKLLHKLLSTMEMFEGAAEELTLWLRGLAYGGGSGDQAEQTAMLDFVHACMESVLKNTERYSSRIVDLGNGENDSDDGEDTTEKEDSEEFYQYVDEETMAAYDAQLATEEKAWNERDPNAPAPVFSLEEQEEEDEEMDRKEEEEEEEEEGTSLFSPLALCAIDALSNKDEKIPAPTIPAVRHYVETVLCGTVRIHNALPPTVLCALLEQNNIAAKEYAVQVWATDSPSKIDGKKKSKKSAASHDPLVYVAMFQGYVERTKDGGIKVKDIRLEDLPLLLRITLMDMMTHMQYYLKTGDVSEEDLSSKMQEGFNSVGEMVGTLRVPSLSPIPAHSSTEASSSEDFLTLDTNVQDPSKVLSKLLSLLLQHFLIRELFLMDVENSTLSKNQQKRYKVARRIITCDLAVLLDNHRSHPIVGEFLSVYESQYMLELGERLEKLEQGSKRDIPEELSSLFSVLLDLLDGEAFSQLAKLLFNSEVEFNDADGVEKAGLVKVLAGLLTKVADIDTRVDCRGEPFADLAFRICQRENATLTEALLDVLQKKPPMLFSLDQRFLNEEMQLTACGERVAVLLLESNDEACRWFEANGVWAGNEKASLSYLQRTDAVPKETLKAVKKAHQKRIIKQLSGPPSTEEDSSAERTVQLLVAISRQGTEKESRKNLSRLAEKLKQHMEEKSPVQSALLSAYLQLFKQVISKKAEERSTADTTDETMDHDGDPDSTLDQTQEVPDSTSREQQQQHGTLLLQLLSATLSINKSRDVEPQWLSVEAVVEAIMEVEEEDLACEDVEMEALWSNLMRYKLSVVVCVEALERLGHLVALSQLPGLLAAMVAHKAYLPAMHGTEQPQLKGALVGLQLSLVKRNHACCVSSHVPVLLGAYGATLSQTDQQLHLLINYYHHYRCFVPEKPHLWGPAAVDRYSTSNWSASAVHRKPSMKEIVSLLNPALLWASALNFPLLRETGVKVQSELKGGRLLYSQIVEGHRMEVDRQWSEAEEKKREAKFSLKKKKGGVKKTTTEKKAEDTEEQGEQTSPIEEERAVAKQYEDTMGYDPAFLLPLFHNLLSLENYVDFRPFLRGNCLAFSLCAISSHKKGIRTLAYKIIDLLIQHFSQDKDITKSTPGIFEIDVMLKSLLRSTQSDNQKLACVITIFLARCSKIILFPEHDMYMKMFDFMLAKPAWDVTKVPEFLTFFHSSSEDRVLEVEWILDLLIDGLRERADYHIYENSHIFRDVMTYAGSGLSSEEEKVQILQVFRRGVAVRQIAKCLIEKKHLTFWLGFELENEFHHIWLVDIVCTLWECYMVTSVKGSCRPRNFSEGMMLSSIQNMLSIFPFIPKFADFVKCLLSVVSHIQHTKEVFDEQKRYWFPEQQNRLPHLQYLIQHYLAQQQHREQPENKSKLLKELEQDISHRREVALTTESWVARLEEASVADILNIITYSDLSNDEPAEYEAVMGWTILQANGAGIDAQTKERVQKWSKKCINRHQEYFKKSKHMQIWEQEITTLIIVGKKSALTR